MNRTEQFTKTLQTVANYNTDFKEFGALSLHTQA